MNPRILLVEDDPVSRAYLVALTEALPASVDAAASVAEALRLAAAARHDLWLLDANLPDGSGAGLLAALRAGAPSVPALAHTAARGDEALAPLRAAGFDDVLVKPVDAAAWRHAIRAALGATPAPAVRETLTAAHALWEGAAAARALGGDAANVAALRGLFLAELPQQLEQIRHGDEPTRLAQLHRLRASCAFVGALRLEGATRRLEDAPGDADAMAAFVATARATLDTAPDPA